MGSRGPIEINPRDTMSKESSIIGVSLFLETEVRNIFILKNVLLAYSNTSLFPVKIICRNESVMNVLVHSFML